MLLLIILQMVICNWIKTLPDVITLLESTSNIAVNWFTNNKMVVNPEKFQANILNKTESGLTSKSLGIGNQQMKTASSVKLLGIQLDDKVNFIYRISNICRSCVRKPVTHLDKNSNIFKLYDKKDFDKSLRSFRF